ncbi:MAG TPA: flagellar basal body L-ring protein FlgH [Bryobacteraceae bacterium]|jgi:flagellar L-ring protein precursor FlgH|nr:flagellar basal body L-ring protein FlgH [Bryobacteraceae bacterium]
MTYRKFPTLLGVVALAALVLSVFPCAAGISNPFKPKQAKKDKPPEKSPLDRYIEEALRNSPNSSAPVGSPGSVWTTGARLTDLGSDVRAARVDDLVTVLVAEHASAVASGITKTQRQSATANTITQLAGVTRATGPWANLANVSGNTTLNGQGQTTRQTDLTTTLSARVTHVLPNGYLVVEGSKDIQVNSERQTVSVRGVVRPVDLSPGNVVPSTSLADLEVHINGKGVVNDAVRRPFFLYRLLLGLMPF